MYAYDMRMYVRFCNIQLYMLLKTNKNTHIYINSHIVYTYVYVHIITFHYINSDDEDSSPRTSPRHSRSHRIEPKMRYLPRHHPLASNGGSSPRTLDASG